MAKKCVITVISHGDAIKEHDLNLAKDVVKNELALVVIESSELSKNRVFDFIFETDEFETLAAKLKRILLAKKFSFDMMIQEVEGRKSKKLFIFDMDSTLIYQEVIELVAAYVNIEDKVAEITERAMNGEIDFNESLKQRVSLLKGIDANNIWEELKSAIQITNGAKDLCKALAKKNVIMGVCSGGFIPLANYIKEQLGLNYAFANQLDTDFSGHLNGTTKGSIVNGEKKAELLLDIAEKHGIDPIDAVAVGDGANDLKMMSVAGFGVAWNAKPKVQELAPCALNSASLLDILYIMGYNESEIGELIV